MLTASFRDGLEVILKSAIFLNRKLARCNQLWLVRDRFHKAGGVWNLTFFRGHIGQGMGMVSGNPTLERIARGNALALCATGSWTARFAPVLERMVADAEKLGGTRPNIFIDASQVSKLDTFGAWLIERLRRSLTRGGVEGEIAGLSANSSSRVDEVPRVKAEPIVETDRVTITGMLEQIGRAVAGRRRTLVGFTVVFEDVPRPPRTRAH